MKNSKWFLPALLVVLAATLPSHPAVAAPQIGNDDLLNGLEGNYILIGKWMKSGDTYSGKVLLKRSGDKLLLTRTVGKITVHGTITIGKSDEGAPVLVLRFEEGKQQYEGTYLWTVDLENYFRLTGDLHFKKGGAEEWGMEALFPDPGEPSSDVKK